MSKDYYNILGVNKSATQEEIKTAFRKMAHKYHPDKAGGDEAKFKEANEAYQVLGNEEKRQQYDRFGTTFNNQGGPGGFEGFSSQGFNFDDLGDMFGGFGDIFGFGGQRGRGRRKTRGNDLEMILRLDFMEAIFGVAEKEISFHRQANCKSCGGSGAEAGSEVKTCNTCKGSGQVYRVQRTILGSMQMASACPDCHGEGKIITKKCSACRGQGILDDNVKLKVKIPAGINTGESIRLTGQGDVNEKGQTPGDLFLHVEVLPHKKFVRRAYDIKSVEEIGVKQAILGDKIEVETVHGPLKLKIPEGTQSGTIFKLKDKGVPKLNSRALGDHLVEIKVKIPKNLSKNQRKILEDLDI